MGSYESNVRAIVDKDHMLITYDGEASDYFECACGWTSSATDVSRRYSQHNEHKEDLVESHLDSSRKPIDPDPVGMSSDIYIRALILRNHRPSQFGCSCGVLMASGPARNAIFDFHIDGLLERTLALIANEIGGDCRG